MTQTDTVDFEAIKERQRMGWEAGDYPRVGNTLQLIAERLVEAADVHAGQRVLDVACGQGNAAIAAARRFADSTGVDYATNLLAQGRERADAEHLPVTFTEGDAEQLPFPQASFDATLSTEYLEAVGVRR
jgi:ubiquinone/menaquinone biosynthesis C-methylase UbiE